MQAAGGQQRVYASVFDKRVDLWLLLEPDTRNTARLRAVCEFIAKEKAADPITSTM